MCGRFTLSFTFKQLSEYVKRQYNIENMNHFELPRYNVAPETNVICVLYDGVTYRIGELRWGFIPSIQGDKRIKLINAKSETIFMKPSFHYAAINRRCIVIADSFYEWNQHDKTDAPRRIMKKDQSLFSMAGIWNTVVQFDGTKVHTVAILTTKANDLMDSLHERMPVILDQEAEKIWLNPSIKDKNVLSKILLSYPSNQMKMYRVSKAVNTFKNQDASLLEELEE